MDAAHLTMTQAAKLRPSPTVPGSMEAAVKMWLQVGNIQKLQQVFNCLNSIIITALIFNRLFWMDTVGCYKTITLVFLMSTSF